MPRATQPEEPYDLEIVCSGAGSTPTSGSRPRGCSWTGGQSSITRLRITSPASMARKPSAMSSSGRRRLTRGLEVERTSLPQARELAEFEPRVGVAVEAAAQRFAARCKLDRAELNGVVVGTHAGDRHDSPAAHGVDRAAQAGGFCPTHSMAASKPGVGAHRTLN